MRLIFSCKACSNSLRRQVVGSDATAGGFEWGYALPGEPTGSNDEYIGYIVRGSEEGFGCDRD
jgi:hypothetical protein